MALRKAIAYRFHEKPYTRKSRKRRKNYIRTIPGNKIVKFHMGNIKRKFSIRLSLICNEKIQMRDNSIEAARITINRHLEDRLGRNNFYFSVRVYPHHILRENKMLTGAGADRMQSGMKKSFGKPMGRAAQMNIGDEIFEVGVNNSGLALAKDAFRKVKAKLPCTTSVLLKRIGG